MDSKIFVTTFNKKLYEEYAKDLVNTFVKTKQFLPFYIFVEDDIKFYKKIDAITYFNLFEEEPELKKFVERNKSKESKLFTFDAVRFSYKVFAQNAARKYGKKIYYVDSDCVFAKQIPNSWYDECLPDDVFISFYDRPNQYTETGFVAFNENKLISKEFFSHYINYYKEDAIYKLNGYTDCHALDSTRKYFEKVTTYNEKKLGDGADGHIMARDKFLNPYLDHRKGPRKKKKHSPEWSLNKWSPFFNWLRK